MTDCKDCLYFDRYDGSVVGECTIKLPPWAEGGRSRTVSPDYDGCDLGRPKQENDR